MSEQFATYQHSASEPYDAHQPRANPDAATAGGAVALAPIQPVAEQPVPPPQQQQAQAQVQQPLLPPGATVYNGGIRFHSSVFANSYSVPAPDGDGRVFYDRSVPLPPLHAYPPLKLQWRSLTWLLKLFLLLLFAYWILQLSVRWTVGIMIPLLLLPTYLLYRQWQRRWQHVELYMLVKLYATAFVPGALVVMLIESVLTVFFAFLCFNNLGELLQKYVDKAAAPGPGPEPDPTNPGGRDDDVPEGMEFLKYPNTGALMVFLFLLSYGSAGAVEEGLKYWLVNRVKKWRPAYRNVEGYLLFSIAAGLGFSTVENFGYVLSGLSSDSSFLGVLLNALGRTFISTPLHVLCAYLVGIGVVRRDLLGERLNLLQVMGWSVFFHGSFDFFLFAIMALQHHWSSGPDDNLVSYVLMACVVVNCFAGLVYSIWHGRRIIAASTQGSVQHAVDGDLEAPPSRDEVAQEGAAGGVHAQLVGSNGFARLQQSEHEPLPV